MFFLPLISLTYALVCPNCISISFLFSVCVFAFILFLLFVFVLAWMLVCLCMSDSIWRYCFCLLRMFLLWDDFALLTFVIDISLTVWPFYNAFSFSSLSLQLWFCLLCVCVCVFCFCYKNISSGSLFIVHFIRFAGDFPHIHTPRRHIDYYS